MRFNLIYFDEPALDDYMKVDDYRIAYDNILFTNGKAKVGIWMGEYINDGRLPVKTHYGMVHIKPSQVDTVWVRGKSYSSAHTFPTLNNEMVVDTCKYKTASYIYLEPWMPKTSFMPKPFVGKKTVVKPDDGYKGQDINIVDNPNLTQLDKYYREGYIFQEFVKCEDYKPLDIKGVHDIRLIVIGGKIVGVLIRQPKEGSEIANLAQGGSSKYYEPEDLPEYALEHFENFKEEIMDALPEDFEYAVFSIDFCNTKDGFKIFELNHFPGIRKDYKTYIKRMREILT